MVDYERIKKYNEELKLAKQEYSKISNEIEFATRELKQLASELSQTLGVEVTPDNIEMVYEQTCKKMNETLENGEEILRRVKAGQSTSNVNTESNQVLHITPTVAANETQSNESVTERNTEVLQSTGDVGASVNNPPEQEFASLFKNLGM